MQNAHRVILFTALVIVSISSLSTQNTFSRRLHFDRLANVFTGIEINDDGSFWVKGISASINPSYRAGNIIARFDANGELEFTSILESETQSFETWSGGLHRLNDTLLYTVGYSVHDTITAFIATYNTAVDGQTSLFPSIRNNFNPNEDIFPKGIISLGNNFLICAELGGGINQSTFTGITYLDENFSPLWERLSSPNTSISEEPHSLGLIDSTHFVLGGLEHNYYLTDNNFISRTFLNRMDTQGNTLWEWQSPAGQLQQGARSTLITDEGHIVVASALGTEVPINLLSSKILWDCVVYEVAQDGMIHL